MPGKGLGNNYLLWIEGSTPGTYAVIQGQGDLKVSRSRDKIDLSDKTSAGYKLSAYGLSDLSITLDVQPNLPDANGYTRAETQCNAQPPVPFNIQIRKGGLTGATGDVVFQASVYGQISGDDYAKNGVLQKSFEFGLAAAPTIDQLAV